MIYGFLRENTEDAIKAGIDNNTGLCRTGLNEYLKVIFPDTDDWIHDKSIGIEGKRIRPDYRSDSLKLIVEFDGLPHYQNPDVILKDIENTKFYERHGYKVVRIPFFIQLTTETVYKWFGVKVDNLFDENIPSMTGDGRNNPAYFCPLGIKRMNKDFKISKKQFDVNLKSLQNTENKDLSGVEYLEW